MAHKHSIYDCDTHFSIDLKTRKIKNDIGKTVIVQNDHNSERFSFELPKEIEGHDMSLCNVVQVHFVNTDSQNKEKHNGLYTVDDLQISPDGDDVVILSWLLSQEATRAVGSLYFGIVFKCIEDDGTLTYSWHTTVNKDFKVVESLDNSNVIIEEYPDVLAQLEARLAAVEQGGGSGGSGSGLTAQQAADLAANAEARHTHSNKGVLDGFGENYAKTLPTFKGTHAAKEITLASLESIVERDNALRVEFDNKLAAVDVDLSEYYTRQEIDEKGFVTADDLPEGGGNDLSNYYTIPEADAIFAKKADIPTDESYELIGQTPLTLENGGNIKLVADGEATYSMVSPTVWNFDDAELTLSNVELDTSEGYYKFTVNKEAAKHTYCYASFVISGLEVGRTYRFVFDTAGRTYDSANRIWTGSLTAYHGTSNAGDTAFSGKALKNGNFDFTAADTSLYVRYVCAMNTTPYLGWVAHFNKMYLNYADMSEELTEIYSNSGAFADVETFKSVPSGVVVTTNPTASVYRKSPTDKTLTQSDVPADAEVTGKEIAEVKSCLPLLGKTVVNFGDSIFGNAQPPSDVSTFLAKKTGATVYNCGFGGCRMSQHGTAEYNAFSMFNVANAISSGDFTLQENAVSSTEVTLSDAIKANFARLKTVDFSKVDIVTIAYSTNDWNGSVALDNEENLYDTTTIGGALRTSIETLLTAYPNARIFVLSTTWRFWHDENNVYTEDSDTRTNSIGLKLADYNAKLKEVAEEYNLPFVDDYNIGINKFNRTQYFSATDGTHHQIEGRKLIASHLAKELY